MFRKQPPCFWFSKINVSCQSRFYCIKLSGIFFPFAVFWVKLFCRWPYSFFYESHVLSRAVFFSAEMSSSYKAPPCKIAVARLAPPRRSLCIIVDKPPYVKRNHDFYIRKPRFGGKKMKNGSFERIVLPWRDKFGMIYSCVRMMIFVKKIRAGLFAVLIHMKLCTFCW